MSTPTPGPSRRRRIAGERRSGRPVPQDAATGAETDAATDPGTDADHVETASPPSGPPAPPHTTPPYMNAIGGAGASGYDWIVQAFVWADQYCPNAILKLNDASCVPWRCDCFPSCSHR